MSGQNKYYTIMFVPEDNARTFSVRIHRNIIRTCILFILLVCAGLLALVLLSGRISMKIQMVEALRNENTKLAKENSELVNAFESMKKVEKVSLYLTSLAKTIGEDTKIQSNNIKNVITEKPAQTAQASDVLTDTQITQDELPETEPIINAPSAGYWTSVPSIRPVEGWLTKKFLPVSQGEKKMHLGLDFAAAEGTPIRSTAPGIVYSVENNKYFGLMVVIEHRYGFSTRYGHCGQILVTKGEHVQRGQAIALIGNTGHSSAPHLHYEILRNGKQVDPAKYMFFNVYE